MTPQRKPSENVQQAIQQQAGKLLNQVAGYVGVRTMEIGLRFGLLEEIGKRPQGLTDGELAAQKKIDPLYSQVWCRAAYASELLDRSADDGRFQLAPHVDKLLLSQDFPGYIGGIPMVVAQPEMFDRFADNLVSGERTWWDQCSPEFIQGVRDSGRPFYTRLIPNGISQVPGLADRLARGARILELACGTGLGLQRLAEAYPRTTLVGVDGDSHSLDVAASDLRGNGFHDRVSLTRSMFEEIDFADEFDAAFINISMHECRDIKKVTANVHDALKPDGHFVISDFPFPDSPADCRTVPARVMCGIQFFEAQIDDQLLPTGAYVDLLNEQGFRNVSAFDLTPVHVVVHGQK